MKISPTSKKNEIFDAYQELLSKIEEGKQVSHQEVKKKQDEETVVAKATEYNSDKIISNIADVKRTVGSGLDQLEQKLTSEYRRLHEIQEAIKLELSNLEEIHQITKNVDTLGALLLAQKEYKARFDLQMTQEKSSFEKEMEEAKTIWEKEQADAEQEKKEREQRLKKERTREEEEYKYAIAIERKRDQDAYDTKKAALEKELFEKKEKELQELAEREKIIASSEVELAQLKDRVESFPKELEKAIKDTEKTTRETLERNYRYQMDLTAKEVDGERKLNAQMISSLQAKIKEQEDFIHQMKEKTDKAGHQVQAIALKALEGSSYLRYHPADETKKTNVASSN